MLPWGSRLNGVLSSASKWTRSAGKGPSPPRRARPSRRVRVRVGKRAATVAAPAGALQAVPPVEVDGGDGRPLACRRRRQQLRFGVGVGLGLVLDRDLGVLLFPLRDQLVRRRLPRRELPVPELDRALVGEVGL